jgi:hypothetical protein
MANLLLKLFVTSLLNKSTRKMMVRPGAKVFSGTPAKIAVVGLGTSGYSLSQSEARRKNAAKARDAARVKHGPSKAAHKPKRKPRRPYTRTKPRRAGTRV